MKNWIISLVFVMGLHQGTSLFAQQFVGSANDSFRWKLIGRAFFDGGILTKDSTATSFQLNDLRLGVVFHILENWDGKIEFSYGDHKVSVKDVYLTYTQGEHRLRIGHFHEPFGYARVGTANFRFMATATSDDILGDKRKLGMTYLFHRNRLNVILGVFSDGEIEDSRPLNQGYSIAGKCVVRPIHQEDAIIHLGVAPRFRDGISEVHYQGGASTDLLSKKDNTLLDVHIDQVINQWKLDLEMIALCHKWYFQGQYFWSHLNRYDASNYNASGYYAQVGYMILGSKHNYNPVTATLANPAPGSLEALFRYDDVNLNDSGIYGGRMTDISLGMNYFLNKYMAIKANYIRVMPGKTALNGGKDFNLFQARLQLSF